MHFTRLNQVNGTFLFWTVWSVKRGKETTGVCSLGNTGNSISGNCIRYLGDLRFNEVKYRH